MKTMRRTVLVAREEGLVHALRHSPALLYNEPSVEPRTWSRNRTLLPLIYLLMPSLFLMNRRVVAVL